MKDVRLGSFALAALVVAGSAQAADPNGAPVYKAPPLAVASSWTGFYAGLGLGFRASRTDVTTTSVAFAGAPLNLAQLATSEPFDGSAFRASPYFGFNWQFAPRWVAGIEGDAGFANQTTTMAGFAFSPGPAKTIDLADSLSVKPTWDASLRGRLGFLLMPATLTYVAGGPVWQHYEVTSTCASASTCVPDGFSPAVAATSTTKMGWTIGGGIESALWGHWLARAEYRYADFRSVPFTVARSSSNPLVNPTVDNFNVAMRSHKATFGLAYKFGHPVVLESFSGALDAFALARSPMLSWGGFYTGLGVGARASRTDVTTTSLVVGGVSSPLTGLATTQPFDGTAFRADPYVGYNWQFAPRWVTGLEADAGFASQTTTLRSFSFSPASAGAGTHDDSLMVKTTWDASLRGRLGFLLTPVTLAYATGGAAWQHYEVTSTCGDRFFCTALNGFTPLVVTNATTKVGWTVGGGIEVALWNHWLARGEYRFADFGTSPFTIARSSTVPLFNPVIDNFNVAMRTHSVTFGLAYKFN
jgi:outer membrane immunogenic protein